MLKLRSLALWAALGALGLAQAPARIEVDPAAAAHAFPHFWETAFGSGRANLSLRASYRADLDTVQRATGFQYVRFHGIFNDENGVYSEDAQGHPVYNWTYVDQIYDGLLEHHVRPYVELSFMPAQLAVSQQPHAFWYKPLPNPPRDYDRWALLIEAFARHLIDRYGMDEVAHWIFEVWNEPNLEFWTGDPRQSTYFELYRVTALALKRVSPRLVVGGPATAQAAWVGAMIDYATTHHVPLDFVSTHVYANDRAEDVFGTHEQISRHDMVARAVRKVHDEIKASARPDIPLYWSEFNASYMNEVDVTDSSYIGPWLASTISACDGLVQMMAYWTFSDVFEEQGVARTPFYGGFGLIAPGGIPKASLNVFRLLHQLGDQRLALDSDAALATRRADGSIVVAVWNYCAPEHSGAPRQFTLRLKDDAGIRRVRVTTIDAQHGSSLEAWRAMGRPAFPRREQQARLRAAGAMPAPAEQSWTAGQRLELKLAPKALALVEFLQE